jgi:ketosteroid isomerase-like protein
MTNSPLPAPIQAFIDATNAADSDAFVATFTSDAFLSDWGREFRGHDGVRSWNRTDNIGVHSHFDLVSATPGEDAGTYTVTLAVSGDGYNGTGPMNFELRDGLIARLVIS